MIVRANRAEILADGGRRNGAKTCPSGDQEAISQLKYFQRTQHHADGNSSVLYKGQHRGGGGDPGHLVPSPAEGTLLRCSRKRTKSVPRSDISHENTLHINKTQHHSLGKQRQPLGTLLTQSLAWPELSSLSHTAAVRNVPSGHVDEKWLLSGGREQSASQGNPTPQPLPFACSLQSGLINCSFWP